MSCSLRSSSLFIDFSLSSCSTSPIMLVNRSNGPRDRALVRPSAIIFFDSCHVRVIDPCWTSCRSQCEWISICLSFVCNFADLARSLIVCRLLYSIARGSSISIDSAFSRLATVWSGPDRGLFWRLLKRLDRTKRPYSPTLITLLFCYRIF